MEWIDSLNDALDYIEDHLLEDIDTVQLARLTYCSSYHFQRMFNYLVGISFSEYIRRRKMSLAAQDLLIKDNKVIDIALKYGYASPTAFNRAFKSVHGVAPSMIKNQGVIIKSYPPLRLKLIVKGVEEMNYRIEKKQSFRIVGRSFPLSKDIENNFIEVPKMWQQAMDDGVLAKLTKLMDEQKQGVLGICVCNDNEDWRYYIAVVSNDMIDASLEEYIVPERTWAIFANEGPGRSIQDLEERIYSQWLPDSGYAYDQGPDIEWYFNADPSYTKYEAWIPIKKKEK